MKFVCGLLLALLALLTLFGLAQARPTVSTTISTNMVFQRNAANCIWGKFANGSITVTLNNTNAGVGAGNRVFTFKNNTKPDGSFELWIPPVVYTYYGYYNFTIYVQDEAPGVLVFTNVIYGMLWLCSGQSNMDLNVKSTFDFAMLKNETRNPNLRLFQTPFVYNATPKEYINTQRWEKSTNDTFFAAFQAVCYAFGREFIKKTGIPTGLIGASWGGTFIETWSSPAALAKCPRGSTPYNQGTPENAPSSLYNGKIYPYRRFAVGGFIWYQGEHNRAYAGLYSCQLPALINDFRKTFSFNPTAPFAFVQLTADKIQDNVIDIPYFYLMRTAMVRGTQNMTNVYSATGIDMGDLESPSGSIHSRNKTLLGQRLFNTIGHAHFGITTPQAGFGPVFQACCTTSNSANITYEITFSGTNNLVSIGAPGSTLGCKKSPFDVLSKTVNADNVTLTWRTTGRDVRYVGNKAYFNIRKVDVPYGYTISQVRYAAYDYPDCLIYNPENVALLIAPQFNSTCSAICPTTTTAPNAARTVQ